MTDNRKEPEEIFPVASQINQLQDMSIGKETMILQNQEMNKQNPVHMNVTYNNLYDKGVMNKPYKRKNK